MSNRFDGYVSVLAPGAVQATSGTAATVALPVCLSQELPRFIRVASTAAACIRLSGATTLYAATTADTLVQPGDCVVMHVPQGITRASVIQFSAAGSVQISPLENQ